MVLIKVPKSATRPPPIKSKAATVKSAAGPKRHSQDHGRSEASLPKAMKDPNWRARQDSESSGDAESASLGAIFHSQHVQLDQEVYRQEHDGFEMLTRSGSGSCSSISEDFVKIVRHIDLQPIDGQNLSIFELEMGPETPTPRPSTLVDNEQYVKISRFNSASAESHMSSLTGSDNMAPTVGKLHPAELFAAMAQDRLSRTVSTSSSYSQLLHESRSISDESAPDFQSCQQSSCLNKSNDDTPKSKPPHAPQPPPTAIRNRDAAFQRLLQRLNRDNNMQPAVRVPAQMMSRQQDKDHGDGITRTDDGDSINRNDQGDTMKRSDGTDEFRNNHGDTMKRNDGIDEFRNNDDDTITRKNTRIDEFRKPVAGSSRRQQTISDFKVNYWQGGRSSTDSRETLENLSEHTCKTNTWNPKAREFLSLGGQEKSRLPQSWPADGAPKRSAQNYNSFPFMNSAAWPDGNVQFYNTFPMGHGQAQFVNVAANPAMTAYNAAPSLCFPQESVGGGCGEVATKACPLPNTALQFGSSSSLPPVSPIPMMSLASMWNPQATTQQAQQMQLAAQLALSTCFNPAVLKKVAENSMASVSARRPPVPKPTIPNADAQLAYEEWIEWRKANEPGYAVECKARQQRRCQRSKGSKKSEKICTEAQAVAVA